MWTFKEFNPFTNVVTFTVPSSTSGANLAIDRNVAVLPVALDTTVMLGNGISPSVHPTRLVVGNKKPETGDAMLTVAGNASLYRKLTFFDNMGASPVSITYDSNQLIHSTNVAVQGRMQAYEYLSASDRNLKKDIEPVSGRDMLDKLRQLQVKTFRFKDQDRFGTHRHTGLIAQEVERVLPETVCTMRDFVPNIMSMGIVNELGYIEILSEELAHAPLPLAKGDRVRFYTTTDRSTWHVASVLDIIDHNITLDYPLEPCESVFIYGSFAEFKTVNYNDIVMRAVAALSYVADKVDALI